MIKITVDHNKNRAVIENMFKRYRKKTQNATRKAVEAATKQAYGMVYENLSGPYSISTLTNMGHPYSKTRHSSISITGIEPFVINKQSGKLRDSLKIKEESSGASGSIWSVGFDSSAPFYTLYVIEGTKKLHGRDVISRTLNNPIAYAKLLKTFTSAYRRG
jgi:hypothetical protein